MHWVDAKGGIGVGLGQLGFTIMPASWLSEQTSLMHGLMHTLMHGLMHGLVHGTQYTRS